MAQWADAGTDMTVTLASLQHAVRDCPAYKYADFETDLCAFQFAVVSRPAYSFGYVPVIAEEEEQSTVF